MTELDNTQLGQYKLIEAIGHGGMATVYKAYQESLDRYVAIKVLRSNRDPQFAIRFKREARAIATLQHHNILPIYDYGEQNDLLYFVMQYVDSGVTLHDILGQTMAPIDALRLIGHVLNALEYAHARGVIHRDIKPANILMPAPNWALLADFGIAKLLNDSQRLTMTGSIIGTAAYMAPEQASGKPVDARTDLYSLGVVLYEMLTGRVPFDAETPMAMLTMHVYEPPPPPRSLNPSLSPAIEAVLLKALAKDPGRRYQNASEMAAAIEQITTQNISNGQIADLYQKGVQAYRQAYWDKAVEYLGRLVAIKPNYQDAATLLDTAQSAQAQALRIGSAIHIDAASPLATEQVDVAAAEPALHCSKCHREAQPEWQRCPYCGTRMSQVTVAAKQATVTRNRPWLRWAAVGTILVMVGGGIGATRWQQNQGNLIIPPLIGSTQTPSATTTASASATILSTRTPTTTATPTHTTQPSNTPSPTDTQVPTSTPTTPPTATPTAEPTKAPTARPTRAPTKVPKQQPTAVPAAPPPTEPPTAEPPTAEPPSPVPPTETPTETPKPRKPNPTSKPEP